MSPIHNQNGGALIVSLVMLLVMTVIGVAAMQTTSLEEKMAGNARDRDLAFQAAETALRAGETWLRTAAQAIPSGEVPCIGTTASGLDATGCYASDVSQIPAWKSIDNQNFWDDPAWATSYPNTLAQIRTNPSYIVERLQFMDDARSGGLEAGRPPLQSYYYRITAHGTGGTTDAVAIVQSTYKTN